VIVLRREEGWTDGRRRLRIRVRGLSRFRTPVLVVAAALFGAAVSAAVLVGFWDKETGRRKALETKLADTAQHAKTLAAVNVRLQRRVVDSRATAVQLEKDGDRLRASAESLLKENGALMASASRLQDRGGSLEQRAASVSKLAGTLGNDLVAVLHYITNTSAGSLDPSYLKAQLDYLRPAVEDVRSAAQSLGADAGSYGTAVDGFTAEAGAYADALRRLARGRAGTR
jgi:uncharacterized protein YbjQ (UPF0145 family)